MRRNASGILVFLACFALAISSAYIYRAFVNEYENAAINARCSELSHPNELEEKLFSSESDELKLNLIAKSIKDYETNCTGLPTTVTAQSSNRIVILADYTLRLYKESQPEMNPQSMDLYRSSSFWLAKQYAQRANKTESEYWFGESFIPTKLLSDYYEKYSQSPVTNR